MDDWSLDTKATGIGASDVSAESHRDGGDAPLLKSRLQAHRTTAVADGRSDMTDDRFSQPKGS